MGYFTVDCLDVECSWRGRAESQNLVERYAENHEEVYGHPTGRTWPRGASND